MTPFGAGHGSSGSRGGGVMQARSRADRLRVRHRHAEPSLRKPVGMRGAQRDLDLHLYAWLPRLSGRNCRQHGRRDVEPPNRLLAAVFDDAPLKQAARGHRSPPSASPTRCSCHHTAAVTACLPTTEKDTPMTTSHTPPHKPRQVSDHSLRWHPQDPMGARKSIMGAELRVRRRDPRAAMIGA